MKLIAAFAAIAAAEWNGISEDSTCGMALAGTSMVNATCTVSGSNIKSMYAGNGAFITGMDTMTGFDGISGDASVVVFFDQTCVDGDCDNSTCWDAELNCTPSSDSAQDGVFFMETVNAAQSGNLNLQIAGVSGGQTVTIQLNSADGPVTLTNITSPSGDVSVTEADGSFSVLAGLSFGDLFQVSVNAHGVVNLWESTVTAV